MDEIRKRLESELNHIVSRIRRMGGAVVFEEFPGAVGDNSPFADEVDLIQVNENREMSFATRSVLIERANKLAEALERLREGEYGTCQECERDHRAGAAARHARGHDLRPLPGPPRAVEAAAAGGRLEERRRGRRRIAH